MTMVYHNHKRSLIPDFNSLISKLFSYSIWRMHLIGSIDQWFHKFSIVECALEKWLNTKLHLTASYILRNEVSARLTIKNHNRIQVKIRAGTYTPHFQGWSKLTLNLVVVNRTSFLCRTFFGTRLSMQFFCSWRISLDQQQSFKLHWKLVKQARGFWKTNICLDKLLSHYIAPLRTS